MNAPRGTDPKYYKWNIFYYNPADTRLFPPKRRPEFGWTINFANPKSIAAMLAMLICLMTLIHLAEGN